MRVTLLVLLTLIAGIAWTGITTTDASAQTIELTDEASNDHCTPVAVIDHEVFGGCPLQAASLSEVHIVMPGDFETLCTIEFEARLDENGHGYIYDQHFGHGSSSACFVQQCEEMDGHNQPWDVELYEDVDRLKLDLELCVEDIFFHDETHCFLAGVTLTATGHGHVQYRADSLFGSVEPGGECSVNGVWEGTADAPHPELEITHL